MNDIAKIWQALNESERELLTYLGGFCDLEELPHDALNSLAGAGLATVANDDEWYGPSYVITDLGREVINGQTFDWQESTS